MNTETIAAIATALTNSGIGIIRLSGPEAFEIIDKIYVSPSGNKKLKESRSHQVHYGYIKDGGRIIDEVMVLVMRAPNTYTREDTVEIDCHGGAFIVQEILKTVLKYGARAAEPGEFTKRAFLNGRIDLSQAEAVMDFINAKNQYAMEVSFCQLKGSVSNQIRKLREDILYQIAFIESALDDPEHISLEGYQDQLEEMVEKLLEQLDNILKQSENGRILTEGIKTVILGKPNAGKSSLLNLLAGEERAIVTAVPGTTRDILKEHIMLGGLSLHIVDTAGIRDTDDIVEKIGVQKAKESALNADFILYVVDSSIPLDKNDTEIIEFIKDKKAVVLLNKTDLIPVIKEEKIRSLTEKQVIPISAKNAEGIDILENAVKELFISGELAYNNEICITNIRQKQEIKEAYQSMLMLKKSLKDGMPEDFYTIDLMDAYTSLGHVIGESVEDDLINEIFEKFCMGK